MSIILILLALLCPSPEAVEALRQSAPKYLTTESAQAHYTASQAAAVWYGVEPELLLAIAYRESKYTVDTVGPTVRGKVACGVMQPLMETSCSTQTLLDGYMTGAKHLRHWLDTKTCRGVLRCAMLGYAGGYALLRACADGPVLVDRNGRQFDLCTIPAITFARAKRIQPHRPAA